MSNVLANLFKKNSPLDKAFSEIEDEFSSMVLAEIETPSLDPFEDGSGLDSVDEDSGSLVSTVGYDRRLTPYTQSRLATLSTFEEMHETVRKDIEALAAIVTKVSATHHSTSDFISNVHNSIHRANELELANAALLAENRRLAQTADRVKRLRSQLETLTEGYKRRETKFNADAEVMRMELGSAQLEANEIRGQLATLENERTELVNELAAKSSAVERTNREAELLREKQVNLTMDLEAMKRRHHEIERKHDELSAIHSTDQSQLLELRAKCAESDKEIHRVQKLLDASQARLAEREDTITTLESEADIRKQQQMAQVTKLNDEIESLKARLEVSSRSLQSSTSDVGALKQKVADLMTESKIAAETVSSLKKELESERKLMADGQKATKSDKAAAGEAEAMRSEIAGLRATIDQLSKYEAMYKRAVQKRSGSDKSGSSGVTVEAAE